MPWKTWKKRDTQAPALCLEAGATMMSKYVMETWGKRVRGGEMCKKVKSREIHALWREVNLETQ